MKPQSAELGVGKLVGVAAVKDVAAVLAVLGAAIAGVARAADRRIVRDDDAFAGLYKSAIIKFG